MNDQRCSTREPAAATACTFPGCDKAAAALKWPTPDDPKRIVRRYCLEHVAAARHWVGTQDSNNIALEHALKLKRVADDVSDGELAGLSKSRTRVGTDARRTNADDDANADHRCPIRGCDGLSDREFWPFCEDHWSEAKRGIAPADSVSFGNLAPRASERDASWRARAACAGVDTAVFFEHEPLAEAVPAAVRELLADVPGILDTPEQRDEARSLPPWPETALAICARCPVESECLAAAMNETGADRSRAVLGGLTFQQRERMRKAARREAA